jgi:hypothetical protein
MGSQKTAQSFGTNTMMPATAAGILRVSVQKYSKRTEGIVEYSPVPKEPLAYRLILAFDNAGRSQSAFTCGSLSHGIQALQPNN